MTHEGYWRVPPWAMHLANLYWHCRATRCNEAARRKWYRYIREERDTLEQLGVDAELVRLACRHLTRPRCQKALTRLVSYEEAVHQVQRIQGRETLRYLSRAGITPRLYRQPQRSTNKNKPINLVKMIKALTAA